MLATGLLSWRPAVHDHLLSTPVRIVLDERTERVDVVLDGHTALRDRELLSGHPGFRPAAWVAEAVQAGQGFGLNASTGDVLRKWCQVSLTTPPTAARTGRPAPTPPRPSRGSGSRPRSSSARRPRGRRRPPRPAAQPAAARRPRRARPVRVTGQETADHARPRACAGDRPRPARGAARPRPPGARRHLRPHRVRQPARRAPARPRRPHRHRPGDGGADGGGDPGPRRVPDLALAAGREEAAARRVAEITERLRGGESDEPAPDPGDGDPELSWMPVRPDLPAAPPVSRSGPPTSSSSSRRRPPRARPARPSGTSTRARCRAPPTCRPWSTPRWPPSNAPNGPRRTCRSASATPTARSSPASTGTRPSSPPRSATSASKATPAAGTAPTSPPARSATPSATGAPSSGPGSRR